MSRSARRPRHRSLPAAVGLALAAALLVGCSDDPGAPEPSPTAAPTADPTSPSPTPEPEPEPEPEFDRGQHSIDDPASIWVVSNKTRPLDPIEYHPADLVMPQGVENEFSQPLREPAARAVEAMHAAAVADGIDFRIISAYRDYGTQVVLYNGYVARDGQDRADTYSARPGHSEHQTGLVVDFDDWGECYLRACFGDTAAGQWLREHAAEHGFIVRYPESLDHVTGFTFEPWHFRYVGPDLALEMRESGILTLEEFFDLPAAPDYVD